MAGINRKKLLIAGVAAGLAMVVADMVVVGGFLSSYWDAALTRLNLPPFTEGGLDDLAMLVGTDVSYGLLIAFLYAAVRPRFGPGVRTALLAALLVWLPGLLFVIGLGSLSIFTWTLVGINTVGSLVVSLVGGTVAGWLYTE